MPCSVRWRTGACCVRNAGVPGVSEVSLRPTTLADLGNRAVIEHDLNVYRVLFALGSAGAPGQRARTDLDFGMLAVPGIDPEPRTRRLLHLDIQTALGVMNIPFVLPDPRPVPAGRALTAAGYLAAQRARRGHR
ncbi:MAG TPA: hypothetical protein VGA04_18600 [Streptosporangiaceae bacterium]